MNGDQQEAYVPTPRPNPRLRPEGESFAERNRKGCGERWYDYSDVDVVDESKHSERVPSDEARRNADTNRGSMKNILGGYCDPPESRRVHPRAVTSESAETAEASKGQTMQHLLNDYGQYSPDPPPVPKLKGDLAAEYAERMQGRSENAINNYGVCVPSDDEVQERMNHISRVTKEDSMTDILQMEPPESAQTDAKGCGRMHVESGECWDEIPPNRHCRPEGEQISRGMNNNMAAIMSMKPKQEGGQQEGGQQERDHQEKEVKEPPPHLKEASTPRPPTATRVRPEGQENYDRNHSNTTMNAIFGRDSNDPTPRNVKVNRMMLRSENW